MQQQIMHLLMQSLGSGGLSLRIRHAHQPAQLQLRQSLHSQRQSQDISWCNTRFAGCTVHIDLNQHLQGR